MAEGVVLTEPEVKLWAQRMLDQIDLDIAAGIVPAEVNDFALLHEYVDANMYAANVGGGIPDAPDPFEDGHWIENHARVQDAVHQVLASRAARRAGIKVGPAWWCEVCDSPLCELT